MKDPKVFYKDQLLKHKQALMGLKIRLNTLSIFRLVLFLIGVAATYFFWGNGTLVFGVVLVISIAFVFLIIQYNDVKYQRDIKKALLQRNELELRVLNRDFYDLSDGRAYADAQHPFSQDIDLFGTGSFFQYINRTALESGEALLVRKLLSNDIGAIEKKQQAIKEMAELVEWNQQFGAVASLVKTEVSAKKVIHWLTNYVAFVPKHAKIFSILFAVVSITVWALYFMGLISGYWVFTVFLMGSGITGKYLKQITKLATQTAQAQSTFRQYAKLLALLENQVFEAELLVKTKEAIVGHGSSSAKALKQFSKLLDALDQRNNILIGIFGNAFFLRDLFICNSIENWILRHRAEVPNWFEAIAFFDAYGSLGNYAFNHQSHVYPKITDTHDTLITDKALHPLLKPEVGVPNDITIGNSEFFVITGANMAGKSTFLRTVGLQIVMSNIGLPICAAACSYTPVKLITSMRTTDSLKDEESYFFSELKRLKFIIDTIEREPHFIILDEILKGTNSTDKAAGSRKFIEKLVGLNASGLIATHDLSLCEVADSLHTVKNYYFEAQIIDDELFFDYQFKEGVCQNMNASFLLHKMEIID